MNLCSSLFIYRKYPQGEIYCDNFFLHMLEVFSRSQSTVVPLVISAVTPEWWSYTLYPKIIIKLVFETPLYYKDMKNHYVFWLSLHPRERHFVVFNGNCSTLKIYVSYGTNTKTPNNGRLTWVVNNNISSALQTVLHQFVVQQGMKFVFADIWLYVVIQKGSHIKKL